MYDTILSFLESAKRSIGWPYWSCRTFANILYMENDMTKQTLSQAIAKFTAREEPDSYNPLIPMYQDAVKIIRTQQRMIEGATNKLTKISKLRRTYNGLPCKNDAADIADEALKQLESEEMV